MIAEIFIAFSFALSFIYLSFYLYLDRGWKSIGKSDKTDALDGKTFLSIIVPFRDEIENIESFLHSIESQNYPFEYFELIMIDDHSEDITASFIDEYAKDSKMNIHVLSLDQGSDSKKKAIELGIKSSKGEIIVTSDVDTTRAKYWLRSISNKYSNTTSSMTVAPVALINQGSFLSAFQSIEFAILQYIGLCYAKNDNPVLCNGANLVYEKKEFVQKGGFENNLKYASGDDIFLMYSFKKDKFSTVDVLADTNALVQSFTLPNYKRLLSQKVRWASKLKGIKDNGLCFLSALSFVSWSYCILAVFIEIIYLQSLFISLIFILLKMTLDYSMAHRFVKKYNQEYTSTHFVLSFLLYPFYYFLILVMSIFTKPHWKGRSLKQ